MKRAAHVVLVAALGAACTVHPGQAGEEAASMQRELDRSEATARYGAYLQTFGIAAPGDRAVEVRDFEAPGVRFFAYAEGGGLRLKAAVTHEGIVASGARVEDAWHALLAAAPDAAAAARWIAWLETDASPEAHGLPRAPTVALSPDRPPEVGIDPAQWSLVTAPELRRDEHGGRILVAWLLAGGETVPARWTVAARPGAPAVITVDSAVALLSAQRGGAASAEETMARARRLLQSGSTEERTWALRQIGDAADRAAVPEVAALLANTGASPTLRLTAAGTLALLADPAAVAPLGVALAGDPASEVRRAAAQALGRIGGAAAVQALSDAAPREADVLVRFEIVHALAAQGSAARAALDRIARDDADPRVRDLARSYAGRL